VRLSLTRVNSTSPTESAASVGHDFTQPRNALLNANQFLLSDFEGRIHLVNQVHDARLWSSQLAEIWREIIWKLESAGDQYGGVARKLTRELLMLAPYSATAEEAYRKWMKDDGLRGSILDPAIVYLVVSCKKYEHRAKFLYDKI